MKILHLIPDDGKTHSLITARFSEVDSTENRYLIYSSDKNKAGPVVGSSNNNTYQFVETTYLLSVKCRRDVDWCDVLMIHFMTSWAASVALRAKNSVVVFWCGWGGDYGQYISSSADVFVLPGTATVPTQSTLPKGKSFSPSVSRIRSGAKKMLASLLFPQWEKRIIERADYFSSPIPEDYELLKSTCVGFRAKYHQICYGSVEALFQCDSQHVGCDNILVGNSATPTNNHIEVFQKLRQFDLGDRKVIVPLSYGDAVYREEIIKIGHAMFGDNLYPLINFMPLADYHQIINSCGILVMNHMRQQALGNINTGLYQGARVFLNPDGVVYSFFKKRGANVFSICEMDGGGEDMFSLLTEEQIQKNRFVLESFWGHDTVLENIRRLDNVMTTHE